MRSLQYGQSNDTNLEKSHELQINFSDHILTASRGGNNTHTQVRVPFQRNSSRSNLLSSTNLSRSSLQIGLFEARTAVVSAVAAMAREGRLDNTAALQQRLAEVLEHFVVGSPAQPQLGATPAKELEIHWVAGGLLAIALITGDGHLNLCAEDESGREIIELDVEPQNLIGDDAASEFSVFLRSLAGRVLFSV